MANDRKNYVLENYPNHISHYDLAMSLLCDNFTSSLNDLITMVTDYFGSANDSDVRAAWNDYNEDDN